MLKKIQKSLTVLFVISALSACTSLSEFYSKDAVKQKPSVASPTYIDYWQTRDPSEYRRSASTTITGKKKSVVRSQDIVIKTKKDKKIPAKLEQRDESRVSLVIPIQPMSAVQVAGPTKAQEQQQQQLRRQPKARTPVAAAKPAVVVPKAKHTIAVSKHKGKRRSSGAGSKNLWDRVRGRAVLADVEHPRINEQIAYLKRNPGYLDLLSQRSRPYLYYIVEQIERQGLPMDLALLPMVESGFEPTAFSPKQAAGLWQIIPSTGQEWGLTIIEGYDGRLDIHTSTGVALNYLRYLHKRFKGDWLLALAAYNAGPNAVQEAIEANAREEAKAAAALKKLEALQAAQAAAAQAAAAQAAAAQATGPVAAAAPGSVTSDPALPAASILMPPLVIPTPLLPIAPTAVTSSARPMAKGTRRAASGPLASSVMTSVPPQPPLKAESVFWRLKLPKETQNYVPRILALSRIVANPAAQGLQLPLLGNQPYLFRVDATITPEVKIADALTLAEIPSEEFFRFNPGLKPGVEPPPRTYNFLLPLAQAQNLAIKVPGCQLVAAKKYTVRKGETLATIAKRHGVPSVQLAQWNHLEVDTVLKAGQQLIVYPSS